MKAQPKTQPEQPQDIQNIKLTFKFYDQFSLPFDITSADSLLEVRQFLCESTILYLYSNFHFEADGQRVNEYLDLATNNIQDGTTIKIVLDEYDKRSARYHVKKVQEVLQDANLLQYIYQQKGKSYDREDFPFTQSIAKTFHYEENDSQLQNKVKFQLQLNDVNKPQILTDLLFSSEDLKTQQVQLVQSIAYSGYNPPSPNLSMKGHLFYLIIKVLEATEFHITASSLGFSLNSSTIKSFNSSNSSPHCYHNLIDLLQDISPLLKKQLSEIVTKQSAPMQPIQLLAQLKYNYRWLVVHADENPTWDWQRTEKWALDLHGLDITSWREWNEELQVFKSMPKSDFVQKLNRDKALVKVHSDFLEASVRGAMAVVDKIIQPLNPMDTEFQQVYVYNQIFFSFAMETPDNFRQETGPDATPTVSTTNCDFRNLKLLHKLEIPGLNLLNTALIDYKGRRVIAQSIIPGILNSDHSNCTQYGSIDEGKTIQKSPEFHNLMQKVCEQFNLDDAIDFLDANNETFNMAGGIEVKGILGSDKRMYLLDLLRLSPRDLNYEDDELHQCCVLRAELIQNYWVTSTLEKLKGDESKESLVKLLSGNSNQNALKLNPAICTKVKIVQNEKINEQKQQLKKISDFLIKNAIPQLIQELTQPELSRQLEANTVSDIFHMHGVNMRYLGKVMNLVNSRENPSLKLSLERVLLCKCLKHLFRQALRESSQNHLAQVLAHLLNCIFAKSQDKQWLDEAQNMWIFKGVVIEEEPAVKKNKNKKKKKKIGNEASSQQVQNSKSLITQFRSEFLDLRPSDLWNRVCKLAKARYDYEFPQKWDELNSFKLNFHKLSCLRELCQLIGVKLVSLPYNIQEQKGMLITTYDQLPFQQEHIGSLEPVVKCIDVISEDAKFNLEMGQKLMLEQKQQESLECYLTAAQILMNLYGTAHRDLALCFSKMSGIYFKKQEFESAVQFQKQAVSIYAHIYGMDHILTAQALTGLALYYFGMKQYEKSFNYILHALYLQSIIGGENSDVFNQFTNLSLLYSESGWHQSALNCLFEALERCELLFSTESQNNQQNPSANLKIAGYYQAIALEHSELGDVQKAVEFQEKACNILKMTLKQEDGRLRDAESLLNGLSKALHEKKKFQTQACDNQSLLQQQKRAFGTNRQQSGQNKEDDNQLIDEEEKNENKEREILVQKLRLAKMNAKSGYRRNQQGVDLNRLLYAQQLYNQERASKKS